MKIAGEVPCIAGPGSADSSNARARAPGLPHRPAVLAVLLAAALLGAGPVASMVASASKAAAASSLERTRAPESSTRRWFYFDQAPHLSPGLSFSFARPVATVNPAGLPSGPGEPRYARSSALPGAPAIETVRDTTAMTRVLGTGLDHDGVTPLLVLAELDRLRLDVFSVANDALLLAESTGVGRKRTQMAGWPIDILNGRVPRRAYDPVAGTVCHGLIVLQCVVWEDPSGMGQEWRSSSVAFVISQDEGGTWQLLFEDVPTQVGHPRGNRWSMQNWWPLSETDPPLQAYFAATDYRANPGANGGRAYLFRATRPATGSPWTIEPTVVVHSTDASPGEHFHTAAALPFGQGGIRFLVAIGDGQTHSRIASLTRQDRNYTDPSGWHLQEDYHGRAGQGSDPGVSGNQFVGCAPGPFGTLLAGSDLNSEQIVSLDPGSSTTGHPLQSSVAGLGRADFLLSRVLNIRTPTPEREGPYVASYEGGDNGHPFGSDRVLYSSNAMSWTQVLAPRFATTNQAIHGGHIYLDSLREQGGVRRVRIPEIIVRRPLEIGPGGFQRAGNASIVAQPWAGITPLQRSIDGLWLLDGQPLIPQPPATGPVYRLTASRFAPESTVGRIFPCGSATDVGDRIGSSALQLRVWVRNQSLSANADPSLGWDDGVPPVENWRTPSVTSVESWIPTTFIGNLDFDDTQSPFLEVYSSSTSSAAEELDMLLAIDSVIEGVGFPGYPLPQDGSSPPVGASFPDEIASISGFQASGAWTATIGAQLPENGWDGTVDTTQAWPIATIFADSRNFVELIADSEDPDDSRLLARVVRDDQEVKTLRSGPVVWHRGSPVLVSVADAGDGQGVRISAGVAGNPVEEMVPAGGPGGSLAAAPIEIRFGSHHGTSGDGHQVHVAPMLWWGGEVLESTALTEAQRAESLECLAFLDPGSPGPPDGDRICAASDNCPTVFNPDQVDGDGDSMGDACDLDDDDDGLPDSADNCRTVPNPGQSDGDGDGAGDPCDNCPNASNPTQQDSDGDSRGDACDACPFDATDDADQDGVCENADNCPGRSNPVQEDQDADGVGDACDNCAAASNPDQSDADGDGDGDACDTCPSIPNPEQLDSDGDGRGEACDNCPAVANPTQNDSDLDGLGDACDPCPSDAQNDADADAVCGDLDNCSSSANPSQRDADGDGVGDACDGPGVLHVSSSIPDDPDYATIQEALDHAAAGVATIAVHPGAGPYLGGVLVDRGASVTIEGISGPGTSVVVDGLGGPAFDVFTGTLGRPVIFRELTVRGAVGIRARVATRIENVRFESIAVCGLDLLGGSHEALDVSNGAGVLDGIRVAAGAALRLDRGRLVGLTGTAVRVSGAAQLDNVVIAGSTRAVVIEGTGGLDLEYGTIVGNADGGVRGAVGGTARIASSIVHGNAGGDLLDVSCGSVSWSDVGVPDCSGVLDNLSQPPALDGQYHLGDGSPCLEHGPDPAQYAGEPRTDGDGGRRLLDFDGDGIARSDCGAYERAAASTALEVRDLSWSDPTSLGWSVAAGAIGYHVYRGDLAQLSYGHFGVCRDDLLASPPTPAGVDTESPTAGSGFFYLVTAESPGGVEGTLGFGSLVERSRFSTCP